MRSSEELPVYFSNSSNNEILVKTSCHYTFIPSVGVLNSQGLTVPPYHVLEGSSSFLGN